MPIETIPNFSALTNKQIPLLNEIKKRANVVVSE